MVFSCVRRIGTESTMRFIAEWMWWHVNKNEPRREVSVTAFLVTSFNCDTDCRCNKLSSWHCRVYSYYRHTEHWPTKAIYDKQLLHKPNVYLDHKADSYICRSTNNSHQRGVVHFRSPGLGLQWPCQSTGSTLTMSVSIKQWSRVCFSYIIRRVSKHKIQV